MSVSLLPFARVPLARTLLVVAALSLVLAACGRRGPLEPPPDPSAPKQQSDATKKQGDTDEEDEDTAKATSVTPSPVTGTKKRPKGYTIPKEPFILDKIL